MGSTTLWSIKDVQYTVERMNANFGRGRVVETRVYGDGSIVCFREPFRCKTEKRRGHILPDGKVRIFGHTWRIRQEM